MAITPPGLTTLAPRLAPSTALLRGSGRGRARSRDPRSLHARVRLEGDGLPGQLARVRDPVTIRALAWLALAILQLALDRSSHWMPSMGRNTADGMDEALG